MCSFAYAHFRCCAAELRLCAVNEPMPWACARLIINSDAHKQLMKNSLCVHSAWLLRSARDHQSAQCRFTASKNSLIAYVWQVIMWFWHYWSMMQDRKTLYNFMALAMFRFFVCVPWSRRWDWKLECNSAAVLVENTKYFESKPSFC